MDGWMDELTISICRISITIGDRSPKELQEGRWQLEDEQEGLIWQSGWTVDVTSLSIHMLDPREDSVKSHSRKRASVRDRLGRYVRW